MRAGDLRGIALSAQDQHANDYARAHKARRTHLTTCETLLPKRYWNRFQDSVEFQNA
jgi:hypothetical protein